MWTGCLKEVKQQIALHICKKIKLCGGKKTDSAVNMVKKIH